LATEAVVAVEVTAVVATVVAVTEEAIMAVDMGITEEAIMAVDMGITEEAITGGSMDTRATGRLTTTATTETRVTIMGGVLIMARAAGNRFIPAGRSKWECK
jgi:hypothetical protein